MNAVKTFAVGENATCQFGNSFDTSGYEENAPVTILAMTECEITKKTYYLVKREGKNLVGRASVPYYRKPSEEHGERAIQGDLYCTNARSWSATNLFGFYDIHTCARSLGFHEEITLPA